MPRGQRVPPSAPRKTTAAAAYIDIGHLQPARQADWLKRGGSFEFSHPLAEQIGGQRAARLCITGFYSAETMRRRDSFLPTTRRAVSSRRLELGCSAPDSNQDPSFPSGRDRSPMDESKHLRRRAVASCNYSNAFRVQADRLDELGGLTRRLLQPRQELPLVDHSLWPSSPRHQKLRIGYPRVFPARWRVSALQREQPFAGRSRTHAD